jgi:hypothetical protein
VHALPSSQAVPSTASGFEQVRVVGEQVPATWHWSSGTQSASVLQGQESPDGEHTPDWQASPVVHASPSSQGVPLATVGFEHVPVAGLHDPTSWQASAAVHVTKFPPTHAPATQLSICVQLFASSQAVPSAETPQAPTPLHVPVRQGRVGHSPLTSEPAGWGAQVPSPLQAAQVGQSVFCVRSATHAPEPLQLAQVPQSVPSAAAVVATQSDEFGALQAPAALHRAAVRSANVPQGPVMPVQAITPQPSSSVAAPEQLPAPLQTSQSPQGYPTRSAVQAGV